tara:strand:- start:334 stop:852 length:519 start_codon:yes stop_codon:yes gene_type:complete
MFIKKTKIEGLIILKTKIFKDSRGSLKEVYQKRILKKNFVFDVMSKSKKGVLRGLHIQTKRSQAKLITVTHGKILDVVVDLRRKSSTFGKYYSLIISEDSDFSLYIPKGFAHGFLCLSNKCTVNYKCSSYRDSKSEKTLKWNDKTLNIRWPVKKPILSNKDKNGKDLNFFRI